MADLSSQAQVQSPANPMVRVFSLRDFRLLFAGTATSLLGDQFALIATPWLVLNLTKDPLALGTVLALEGLPRAALMLFGGAITDHLSSRHVMIAASVIRLLLTATMAVVVLGGAVQLWMIYLFGVLFGTVAGLAIPAETSIVPTLVGERDLQAGNAVTMGTSQLAGFAGPTIAGILIGRFAGTYEGVGLAYAFDALTFVAVAVTLLLIRSGSRRVSAAGSPVGGATREGVVASITAGIRYLWTDPLLRFVFLVLAAVNFLLMGPLMVGIPVLASQRLPEGAAAFGLLMSAFAGGNLLGYLLAGALPGPAGPRVQWLMVVVFAAYGLVIGSLGLIPSTWIDVGLLLLLGLGNGYLAVLMMTWMQNRTPKDMLGRTMSLVMLAGTGLAPISQAAAGALSKWSLDLMFAVPGVLMLLLTAWIASRPEIRGVGASLTNAADLDATGS